VYLFKGTAAACSSDNLPHTDSSSSTEPPHSGSNTPTTEHAGQNCDLQSSANSVANQVSGAFKNMGDDIKQALGGQENAAKLQAAVTGQLKNNGGQFPTDSQINSIAQAFGESTGDDGHATVAKDFLKNFKNNELA